MALNKPPPLGNISQTMSRMGRGGDTTLVHMNPQEVRGLASVGKLTTNPVTGLPEAFALPLMASVVAGITGLGAWGTAGAVGLAGLLGHKRKTGKWDVGKAAMGALMNFGVGQLAKGLMADNFMTGVTNLDTSLRDVAGGTTSLTMGKGPPGTPPELGWLGRAGKGLSETIGGEILSPQQARGAIGGLATSLGAGMLTPPDQNKLELPSEYKSPSSGFNQQEVIGGIPTGASQGEIESGLASYQTPTTYQTAGLTEDVYPGEGFPNLMAAKGGSVDSDYEGYVGGDGHGMEDNQMFNIKGGGLAALSPKEYVVPADVMSSMGNGNPDDGAKAMDGFISKVRKEKYGRDKQPPEMDARKQLEKLT
jgi:hypothetical protein